MSLYEDAVTVKLIIYPFLSFLVINFRGGAKVKTVAARGLVNGRDSVLPLSPASYNPDDVALGNAYDVQ